MAPLRSANGQSGAGAAQLADQVAPVMGDLNTGVWLPLGTFAALLGSSSAACVGAMGPGFGTVVISETETEAAADSTEAALRVTYCVMITRARERG